MLRCTTTLTGHDAIEYARERGLTLSKYADPIEDAREGLSVEEAEEIASEDPSLVYVEVRETTPNGRGGITIDIPEGRLDLLDTATLSRGSHSDTRKTCARELVHLVVTGEHRDRTPECLTAALAALPPLNDGPWRDDGHRTATIRPWLRSLLQCQRDDAKDIRISYRLADLAVREIAPDALDAAELREEADRLRGLDPVTDAETARAAVRFARAAARAARAARAATAAAADDGPAAIERWTTRILEIICEEYGVKGPDAACRWLREAR